MNNNSLAVTRPDLSARAGILAGAFAIGASFQPNLLTRGSRDQALISAVSAAVGYGTSTAAHSLWHAASRRLPGGETMASEAVLAVGGLVLTRVFPPTEHEPSRNAALRLVANGAFAVGVSTLVGRATRRIAVQERGPVRVLTTATMAMGACVGTYVWLNPGHAVVGAQEEDGSFAEDSYLEVKPVVALTTAAAVTTGLLGLGYGESFCSRLMSRGAAKVFGGSPEDHRTFGRVLVLGLSAFAVRQAVSTVTVRMAAVGDSIEAAHAQPPDLPEVTGSPASHLQWDKQSREGRRWLSMVLRQPNIAEVMGESAKQPIRVYASMAAAATDEQRANLLMSELDRTDAFSRSVLAVFSPTGSGYVNYVASETLEYLTRGDCASACIEYSVLPSSMSLLAVPLGTRQTRLVVDKIVERLLKMPVESRPKFVLFGESLGSQVSQGMFTDQGVDGPNSVGLDAAVWIGTPSASTWRKQLWGSRSVSVAPEIGPADAYLPRSISEWNSLPPADRARVRYLLLQNGDDPIPKFGEQLLWRRPDWLGPSESRPPGSPTGTKWFPFITFFQTFIDMINALSPTPGTFAQGGHDYRIEIPEALRTVWKLDASVDQMTRVQAALRQRELGWETARIWQDAETISDSEKRGKAEVKVEEQVAGWTGAAEPMTRDQVGEIMNQDIQPT